jgi:thiosulfate dehydrogenase
MNGRALALDGIEMKAMVAYIKFLSQGVPVGAQLAGRGGGAMKELERAADPSRGKQVFAENCALCHGADGQGKRRGVPGDAKGYEFPPLWGSDSFNDGAGMNRLISGANFVHSNMPNGVTYDSPMLSVEDAWDVMAFVQSMPRPHKDGIDKDFPVRAEKPVDAGYGPYIDDFPASQHRLGPFAPIRAALKSLAAEKR